MTVRKTLLYPDPFLRRVTQEICSFDRDLQKDVQDMIATMHGLPHCVGIAANQVGIDKRVFVMDTSRRTKSSQGLVVIVNPAIIQREGKSLGKEGCLSLPTFLGRVARSKRVQLAGKTPEGREMSWSFQGLEAICAQHELDHLNGMLFIDRLHSLRADLFLRGK